MYIINFFVVLWYSQVAGSEFRDERSGSMLHQSTSYNDYPQCRCFPGDECWPTMAEWAAFNSTVGGRLIATVPIASPCHYDNFTAYDADACASLQAVWGFPATHFTTASSPMAAWFANDSCSPFTSPSAPCVVGTYVQYAVNATGKEDFQATLSFATERNIRLVIRNTGHDYLGKSTGAGALALWTHHLKEIEPISKYSSDEYEGPAMKFGAGVQAFEAYAAADAEGLAIVGGACQTVGIAGGYSQGGGLSPLASTFGLAADQVLEWEVVTAGGEHLVANPNDHHSDLYWALSGGGGGTYAAVLSMTVRAYPTMRVASANLTFSGTGVSGQGFRDVMETYLLSLPSLAEAGTWSSFYLIDGGFQLVPVFGPNLAAADLQAHMDPTLTALKRNGISYEYHIIEHDTFKAAYDHMVPINNVTEASIGGRLIPRSLLETHDSVQSLMDVFEYIVQRGGVVSGIVTNQTRLPNDRVQNSVNPVFRTSVIDIVVGIAYDETNHTANILAQEEITNSIMPQLQRLTPGGGSYLNEGDINQPNWQQEFYGENYEALERIKDKYDPLGLFYGLTSVGSERWVYRMQSDGKLCRAPK